MTDILIKNMDLPTEGEQVNITILSDGSVIEHFRNERGTWSSYKSGGVKAMELPPHGRLGDLDLLCERLLHAWHTADKNGKKLISEVMADVVTPIVASHPTVLEASKERE